MGNSSIAFQDQQIQSDSENLIDYSVPGNRLRYVGKGSVSLVPFTPVEVICNIAIRPMLDCASSILSRSWGVLKRSASGIDRAFTRTISFLPTASANPVVGKSVVIFAKDKLLEAAAIAWTKIGFQPDIYGDFVYDLTPTQRLSLLDDEETLTNINAVYRIVQELSTHLYKKAGQAQNLGMVTYKYCEALHQRFENVQQVLNDLTTNGERSKYAPTNQLKVTCKLPYLEEENNSITLFPGGVFRNGIGIVSGPVSQKSVSTCSTNPIEEALFAQINNMGPALKALNIESRGDNTFTFDHFKMLFSTKIVKNLEGYVNVLKEQITNNMIDIEKIVKDYHTQTYAEPEKRIRDTIHGIFLEQEKQVDAFNAKGTGKTLDIIVDKSDAIYGLVQQWHTIEHTPAGYIFGAARERELFNFEISSDSTSSVPKVKTEL